MNTLSSISRRWGAVLLLLSVLCVGFVPSSTTAFARSRDCDERSTFNALIVIGDSLSDVGRTASVLPPDVLPVSVVAGRFCNGPVWPEYLAPQLGLAFDASDDFAWAGAFTGRGNVFTGLPGMLDELDELLGDLPPHHRLDSDALYVVFGGPNDFFQILQGAPDPQAILDQGSTNIANIVDRLHRKGAKHIVVINMPDIGLTPRARLANAGAISTAQCHQFNVELNAKLNRLGFPIIRVNSFRLLQRVAAHPALYGFTDVNDIGLTDIPNSGTYLFWDDVHTTTRMQAILAKEVKEAVENDYVCVRR